MDRELFNNLMKESGLNKRGLSELLGTSYNTVNAWGTNGRDYPYWVESWLNLYNENKNLKEIKQLIQDSGLNKK